MDNKFYKYIFLKWFVISLFSLIGCKKYLSIREVKSSNNERQQQKDIALEIGNFKLELRSSFIEDTLNGKWEDEPYGTPILKEQSLVFYKNGLKLKNHLFPVDRVVKTAKNTQEVNVVAIPIFDICLIIGESGEQFYYVYGSDFCNGVDCPEFTGLYDMNGNIIYEGISTDKSEVNKSSLSTILKRYALDINEPDTCQTIINIWK